MDENKNYTAPVPALSKEERAQKFADVRLYLCVDARQEQGDLEEFLRAAYRGGVDLIQLRDKKLEARAEIEALEVLARVAREEGKLFSVNDRADVALLVNADVFHVGQGDLTTQQARALLGDEVIIGRSTNSVELAQQAIDDEGLDYFCTGPVWETPTKPGRAAVGPELVKYAAEHAGGKPFFGIGGVNAQTLPEVRQAGADRVVVVRAITEAEDPEAAAAELSQQLREQR
ncbi:thiamine phosphate synthase [Micrococcoides hystricis]|uniref:Thiamine-phosphate synthase n=1 Tax=Micrococcoides hystricis TaxID=1572761 RepID=A0ABV6PAQ8_9MICC